MPGCACLKALGQEHSLLSEIQTRARRFVVSGGVKAEERPRDTQAGRGDGGGGHEDG